MKKTNRAVIITGKLVQDHEFIYPYYRLKEEGFDVDIAVRGKQETQGQIGVKVIPTKDIPELKVSDYDVLVIPGGAKCMEYLRQDKDILKFIADFHAAGKVISSICHAAQMLISAKLVKGRKVSGYYSIRDDIENAGGIYVDEPAVIDDRIVSTAHYKDLGPWMKATIKEVAKLQG
jgi:protease I